MSAKSTGRPYRIADLPQGRTNMERVRATTNEEIEAQAREDGCDLHEIDWSAAEVVVPVVADAAEDSVKATLADALARALRAQGLTQKAAAKRTGLAQSDVSNLVHGRLASFSLERIARALTELGQDVDIVVRPAAEDAERGHLRVLGAA